MSRIQLSPASAFASSEMSVLRTEKPSPSRSAWVSAKALGLSIRSPTLMVLAAQDSAGGTLTISKSANYVTSTHSGLASMVLRPRYEQPVERCRQRLTATGLTS